MKKPTRETAQTQREKFEEAARKYGSDIEYDDALEKVAKAPKLTDDEIKKLARLERKNTG